MSVEVVSSQGCQVDNQDLLPQGLCKLEAPAIFYIDIIRQSGFIYFGELRLAQIILILTLTTFAFGFYDIYTHVLFLRVFLGYIYVKHMCVSHIFVCVCFSYICVCMYFSYVCFSCVYVCCVCISYILENVLEETFLCLVKGI